jgi:uncharacterized repeat protein (TIGR04042 family)
MPEMTFTVRWPDGTQQQCYSPSLVMHDFLEPGVDYALGDFVSRSTTALTIASDRVRAKFGFACTSAAAQIEDIEAAARQMPDGHVTILTMSGAELLTPTTAGQS